MTTCNVSAVLLNWRRPFHIPAIVERLRGFPQVAEIVCYDNSGVLPDIDGCRVIRASRNICTLGRFKAAQECRYPVVVTQDDDLLFHNLPDLLARFDGTRIVANLAEDGSSHHWNYWHIRRPPWIELGFGSVFLRQWADVLDTWPFDGTLLERKADKIFSMLHMQEPVCAGREEITRLYYEGEESGRDDNALFRRDDHRLLTDEAVRLFKLWKK